MPSFFSRRRPAPAAFQPRLEALENRVALDARHWINPAGGLWSVAENWERGIVPGPNDDAVIDIATSQPVTHATGSDSVRSLTSVSAVVLSGGSLSVSGAVRVDAPATLALSGGTLRQATVTAGTTVTGNQAGGTLDGVTLNGEIDLFANGFNGAVVSVTNGLTLNGIARLDSNFFGAALLRFVGSQVLDGTGTVFFLSGQYSGRDTVQVFSSGTTLVIGPGVHITGAGAVGYNAPEGGAPDVSFINEGTLTDDVPNGTLTLNGDGWVNAGTLQSNFGSVINLAGNMDNADSTGAFAGAGFFTVSGTVAGGTVNLPAGAKLHGNGGTLDGVTVNGDIDLTAMGFAATSLNVTGGLTLNGTAALNDSFFGAATLRFVGTQALEGAGTIVFGPPAGTTNAVQVATEGAVLTLGPGIAIRGQFGTVGGSGNVAFINQGTIAADVPGGTVTLDGTGWANVGTAEAANGGTLLAQGTPANFAAGTLAGGTWRVLAYSTLRLLNSGITTNAAAIDLEGLNSNFYRDTTTADALANLAVNAGSFSIGLGRNFTTAGPFVNVGGVTVGDSSRLTVTGNYVQPAGLTTLNGGVLVAPLVDIEGGTLAGRGTIMANVRNAGELDVGGADTPGTLTITGDYTQTGVLNLKLGTPDAGGSDRLNVTGFASLGGTLNVTLLDGFFASPGDTYIVLTFGGRVGDFATVNLPDIGGGLVLDPVYGDGGLSLIVSQGV